MKVIAAEFSFAAFALAALGPLAVGAVGGCSNLTSPPEPIAVDTTTATAASIAPKGSAPSPHGSAPIATAAPHGSPTGAPTASAAPAVFAKGDDKLQIVDVVVGKGQEAKAGDTVSVHYVGTLMNGTEFDSSKKRGQPFTFPLGAGRVIKGWDQGVAGMKVGGKRKLTIPPSLGYGDRGAGTIPPNSPLQFEVELLEIKKK